MKCPFCEKHIRYLGTDLFTCDTCHIMLPAKHWIAYINTRKALNIAKDAIHSVVDHNIINCMARDIDPRTDDTSVTLCNALEQIIALEQAEQITETKDNK